MGQHPLPNQEKGLNPYFIGLPILIVNLETSFITLPCLNPYFIGLPILIISMDSVGQETKLSLNPYFIGLPILILRLYNPVYLHTCHGLNPYFIGLPILISTVWKLDRIDSREVSILILLDYLFL